MDAETIITLVIIAIAVLWNLISKMRQRMGPTGTPPMWPRQNEPVEMYEEDLSPYTVIESQDKSMASEVVSLKGTREPTYYLAGKKKKVEQQPVPETIEEVAVREGRAKKYRGVSSAKLREAVIWAEILAPPLSLRSEK